MEFFFLSQVLGKPVLAGASGRVARIKDLVARLEVVSRSEVTLEDYPPISGLMVEVSNTPIFVPWGQVQALGPQGATLNSATVNLRRFKRRQGEVLLARDILDKQLIDIDGRRVIRANDIQLYAADGAVRVTAVDVSGEALARRLSFGRLFNGKPQPGLPVTIPLVGRREDRQPKKRRTVPAKLINWADVEPLAGNDSGVQLRQSHERLALLNPVDIAHILDDLSYAQGAEIIESLDDETAADTLQEMDEDRQADIVESMDRERAADILEEMDPDEAADLLADLQEAQAQDLLRRMDRDEAEDVQELLAYEENSAGGIMTSDFISLPPSMTVDRAIALMRGLEDAPDRIDDLFIVEEENPAVAWAEMMREAGGKLLGIVTLRDLLLARPDQTLEELMETDVVWIADDASPDAAARLIAEYNLMALPVLDDTERIRGIITVDDAMDVLLPDRRSGLLQHVFS
ncbi:MAG TPA: CBS domain-containing protein [Chloroflexota bacterium]|nr:CBS domain-containing protein [Chloroflexota bacterium]